MSDRELLDRIRAVRGELDDLIEGADFNSKYHTKGILERARFTVDEADSALKWHVESD